MDISQLRFTFAELISLLGMSQAVFIVVYILFRARTLVTEWLPLAYFSLLAAALFLDAGMRMLGSHFSLYPLLQWSLWFAGPPLSALLVFQIALVTRPPSLSHYRVLLLLPIAFIISYWAVMLDKTCVSAVNCIAFYEMLVVSGVIAGALSFLEIWMGRSVLDNLRIQKNGRERYWLIITLIVTNLAFLALMLASLGGVPGYEQVVMTRGILAIALSYLASTSLFRIYPQSIRSAGRSGEGINDLADIEIEMAMKIEKLLELDKVYQEPSYSRADLARELGVSEAVLSRIINVYFQKNFPQLLNEKRVEDAKRLLRQTSISINLLPAEVGFNSLASFNRVFKEITGEAPTKYRQNNTEI